MTNPQLMGYLLFLSGKSWAIASFLITIIYLSECDKRDRKPGTKTDQSTGPRGACSLL
jgi:hypothetical protein